MNHTTLYNISVLCDRLSSINPKGFCYSYAWPCSLCEGGASFCTGFISRKLSVFLFVLASFRVLIPFGLSITFVLVHSFWDLIWSNIDEVFSITSSDNVFTFGGFKACVLFYILQKEYISKIMKKAFYFI